MAEIGLVGSIFSVAAVGVSLATTLYEAADVMIHANLQILDLAKHVSQFTAVLRHMGQVLEPEKLNCSKEVLRDTRKIKHSSKRTFKEINSALKSKRFQHFVPVRWLFKRTKAMELQQRLDSQQSMLQCIIHTLTVSKLSHMDSRSKEDSQHITGLKAEIRLLKTFIMESYNNLTELRRAEQSTDAESRVDSIYTDASNTGAPLSYGDNGNASLIPVGVPDVYVYERPTTRSPSIRPGASKFDDEAPDSGDGADDDVDSTTSTDQSDKSAAGGIDTTNEEGLFTNESYRPLTLDENDGLYSRTHRESNILLQMVPYRPRLPNSTQSDRFICGGQSSNSGRTSAKQEATNSVRLLLDKWTNSGSAPISNILDEEAAKEKDEADRADKRRNLYSQSDSYRRPLSPGAELDEYDSGPQRYPEHYRYPSRFQGDHVTHVPPPRIRDHVQPEYEHVTYRISVAHHKDFWRPSHTFPHLPDGQMGMEILAALRSTRGGIQYAKSSKFEQVHFVDHRVIYECAYVPWQMIPHGERNFLNTELDRGLVRKEALDLLGYSYTETKTGKFSISDDLELRDIEELVKLSYQALDRVLRERSKAVIKERGWAEAIDVISRDMPSMYSHEPPPMAEYWNHTVTPYIGYPGLSENTEYTNAFPIKTASSQIPLRRPEDYGRERLRSLSVSAPPKILRQRRGISKPARPEVRFTLPHAQRGSSTADTTNESQAREPTPNVPQTSKTNDEVPKLIEKLERAIKKLEECKRSEDHQNVADLTYYVIPDLKNRIEKEQQREEQESRSAPQSGNDGDKKSRATEVETESEESDDDGV